MYTEINAAFSRFLAFHSASCSLRRQKCKVCVANILKSRAAPLPDVLVEGQYVAAVFVAVVHMVAHTTDIVNAETTDRTLFSRYVDICSWSGCGVEGLAGIADRDLQLIVVDGGCDGDIGCTTIFDDIHHGFLDSQS